MFRASGGHQTTSLSAVVYNEWNDGLRVDFADLQQQFRYLQTQSTPSRRCNLLKVKNSTSFQHVAEQQNGRTAGNPTCVFHAMGKSIEA